MTIKTVLPQFSLTGQVALVTGAGRGLGLEMAKGLAAAGAIVYINGRNAQALEATCQQLGGTESGIRPLAFDVEDLTAVESAVEGVIKRHGAIDILINNVGVRDRRGTQDLEHAALQNLLNNHVVAPFDLAKLVVPAMITKGFGRIINMISVSAFIATPGDAGYSAAKGALAALTRAMAADFGAEGITVNAIAPGAFATETNAATANSEQGQAMIARRTSVGRWGKPEEIAGAAVFLASPAASYITGHVLAVDGGLLAHY